MKKIYKILACVLVAMYGCKSEPKDCVVMDHEAPIFPDYNGVTIPAGIAPLNFNVDMEGVEKVYVKVTGSKGGEVVAQDKWANFDIEKWHALTNENRGGQLTVAVYAKADGQWHKYPDFTIYVSQYPLDEWGLTYRRIAPGYEVYSRMGLYQRDLSNFKEYPIIDNIQTSGQCYNCHTSNRTNPKEFAFHVRGDYGATMIQRDGERQWLQAVNDSLGGAMVYPYWHPSGKYCAFSTNQTRQSFHIACDKRLEVFDFSSDILVYDIDKREIITNPATSTKDWSENCPVFAPDGKSLYFTTCKQKTYPAEYKEEQYNLCRVAFDPATGKIGETVDTIFDAVAIGKSVTWPRPSYDGKYLLFTLADYGYFSIWHKEADQWLLDLATGEAQPLAGANSDDTDSFHNWSVNSHWIVFTSRRGDGLYTRLYIAEIGEDGKAAKPFLLPQNNPQEYYEESLYSFNTPDFTACKVDFDSKAAVEEILSDQREKTTMR